MEKTNKIQITKDQNAHSHSLVGFNETKPPRIYAQKT